MVFWVMSKTRRGGVREYDDTQGSLSAVWIKVVQKKRPHSHRQAKSPLRVCGRAFVLTPENFVITAEQRALIERLLLERISLRGICWVMGVGLQWLLQFMVERFQAAPEDLCVKPADGIPAAYQCH